MLIAITPTPHITEIGGQPVRLWEGVTDHGTKCHVYVATLAVAEGEDTSAFDRELRSMPAPAESVPLWMLSPSQGGHP